MGGTLEHLEKEYFRLHKEIVEERLHILAGRGDPDHLNRLIESVNNIKTQIETKQDRFRAAGLETASSLNKDMERDTGQQKPAQKSSTKNDNIIMEIGGGRRKVSSRRKTKKYRKSNKKSKKKKKKSKKKKKTKKSRN